MDTNRYKANRPVVHECRGYGRCASAAAASRALCSDCAPTACSCAPPPHALASAAPMTPHIHCQCCHATPHCQPCHCGRIKHFALTHICHTYDTTHPLTHSLSMLSLNTSLSTMSLRQNQALCSDSHLPHLRHHNTRNIAVNPVIVFTQKL